MRVPPNECASQGLSDPCPLVRPDPLLQLSTLQCPKAWVPPSAPLHRRQYPPSAPQDPLLAPQDPLLLAPQHPVRPPPAADPPPDHPSDPRDHQPDPRDLRLVPRPLRALPIPPQFATRRRPVMMTWVLWWQLTPEPEWAGSWIRKPNESCNGEAALRATSSPRPILGKEHTTSLDPHLSRWCVGIVVCRGCASQGSKAPGQGTTSCRSRQVCPHARTAASPGFGEQRRLSKQWVR